MVRFHNKVGYDKLCSVSTALVMVMQMQNVVWGGENHYIFMIDNCFSLDYAALINCACDYKYSWLNMDYKENLIIFFVLCCISDYIALPHLPFFCPLVNSVIFPKQCALHSDRMSNTQETMKWKATD